MSTRTFLHECHIWATFLSDSQAIVDTNVLDLSNYGTRKESAESELSKSILIRTFVTHVTDCMMTSATGRSFSNVGLLARWNTSLSSYLLVYTHRYMIINMINVLTSLTTLFMSCLHGSIKFSEHTDRVE